MEDVDVWPYIMVASAIFFLDSHGKPLLSRNYRGDVPVSAVEHFPRLLMEAEETSSYEPCITFEGINYMYITHNNIYVLALSRRNSNAASVLLFLHHIIDVFTDYFKEVQEESIRDNFVIIYELLDEMMDFGHPQITDPKILQEYITQESHELDISGRNSSVVTSAISWRPEGIHYKKNELFLDVVESLNILMSSDGKVIRSEVQGKVNVNAYLSGMPILKLGLNESERKKIASQANGNTSTTGANHGTSRRKKDINLEDVKFHQCVQLEEFEKDRTISFVPPDGKFELMNYRIRNFNAKPMFLVTADVDVKSHSRVLVSVKATSQYRKRSSGTAEFFIPVPPDADSPKFKADVGTVVYAPEKNAVVWRIKQFGGGQSYRMTAQLQLSSIDNTEDRARYSNQPVYVKFEIPYFAVSGLQVRYLKITEPVLKYQSFPWVRYLTKSGDDYAIRLPKS